MIVAFVVASFAASFATLSILLAINYASAKPGDIIFVLVYGSLIGTAITIVFSAIPGALILYVMERNGIRSSIAYTILGGLCALLALGGFYPVSGGAFARHLWTAMVIFGAGFIGGWVYWQLAGRHAGNSPTITKLSGSVPAIFD